MKRLATILVSLLCAARAFPADPVGAPPTTASVAEPADAAATWELLPEAKVDGTGIFLNQIFIIHPRVVPPLTRLAAAPTPGQTASFSRAQIAEWCTQAGVELPSFTNWTGAAQIRVSRRTRAFESAEMTTLLTAEIQNQYVHDQGELELQLTHPWTAVTVPDEPLVLKVTEMRNSGVTAFFVVRFELTAGKEVVGNWQQPVQAHVWRDLPVAHSTLTRGQLLRDADIAMERRDLLSFREACLAYPNDSGTLELRENVQAGSVLMNHSVRTRPIILRGQVVEGLFRDGALNISLKVETLEDGFPGQMVRVRNPKTRRELYGKVQNEQTVLIVL